MMLSSLTNLLPADRARVIKRLYFVRLATVSILMLSIVGGVTTLLLLPSYLYLHQEVLDRKGELDRITTRLAGSQESGTAARMTALKKDVEGLTTLSTTPAGTTAFVALLNVARPGIVIRGLTYTAPVNGGLARITLSGTAGTRESLRRYILALSNLPYVSKADLPISAYAQETDIDFTATLTGVFIPGTP